MKRFLSILIAAVMVITMLPTIAFAEGEVAAEPVEYLLNTSVAQTPITGTLGSSNFTAIDTYEEINEEKTALWAYSNSTPGSSTKNMTGERVMVQFARSRFETSNAFISFKLKVENPGWYDLTFFAAKYKYGPDIDVYFGSSTRTTMVPTYKSDLSLIGTVETYEENASGGTFDDRYDVGKVYIPATGDYYILFNCISSDHYDPDGDIQRIYLSKIMLTPTPPASVEVFPGQIALNSGEVSEPITATVKDAGGNILSGVTLVYESENSAIATVDETTGKVTGIGDGETSIIVKVEGYDITAKIPVTVRDYMHEYIFNSTVLTEDAIKSLTVSEADKNNGLYGGVLRKLSLIADDYEYVDATKTDLWAYSSLGTASGNLAGSQFNMGIPLTSIGNDIPNSRFVLKVKIKYPGIYDLGIEAGKHTTAALSADVYMLKSAGVESLSNSVIRSTRKIGTIDGSIGSSVEDILGTVELEAGDYYLIFDFWNDMANGATKHNFYPKSAKLTLHEGEVVEEDESVALESNNLSFSLGSTEDAEIKVNGNAHTGNTVYKYDRAETVTVEAGEAPDGYRFKAWVQGTADNGLWKSSDSKYTFNIMTHTYLTAVYEKIPSTDYVVEYYNENGKLLATKEVNGTTPVLPEVPSLTGYTFNMWTLDGKTKFDENSTLTERLTRAVAKYNANAITENNHVKYDGEDKTAPFGTPVSVSNAAATHWLRDGRVVAYGTEYTHYIWDGTSIYCSYAEIEKKPLVVIEDTLVDGAAMIEYDAGNKQIIETGILFGEATVEIGSCEYKATSQWNKSHGQFTALPSGDENYARGYLIYNDGGVYKVIYTEAVAVK
ncbi:MAG: hypothetical protein IJP38_09850 [Oscillospiraceae bacterium]|nr:hypothetical protein [Oscillospiraceae bacterium]MBQ9986587.1 hypothetical protein [Oscillospiraceae bacterium]